MQVRYLSIFPVKWNEKVSTGRTGLAVSQEKRAAGLEVQWMEGMKKSRVLDEVERGSKEGVFLTGHAQALALKAEARARQERDRR